MSTSISPSIDLTFRPELANLAPAFTTFRTGHFVKPAKSAQPAFVPLTSFEGAFADMYCVEGLDLDYDEPNAVVENEMEFVVASHEVVEVSLPVIASDQVVIAPVLDYRAAA